MERSRDDRGWAPPEEQAGQASAAETSLVDTSLIDEMLRLSPAERLRQNDRVASLAAKLQAAFAGRQPPWPDHES
jgi:hypothetical protein